jgi:SAM-dependent methyltransferase
MLRDESPNVIGSLLDRLRAVLSTDAEVVAAEDQLAHEFQMVVPADRPRTVSPSMVVAPLAAVDLALPPFQTTSRSTLGRAWHTLVGKTARRDSNLLLDRLAALRQAQVRALHEVASALNDLAETVAQQSVRLERQSARLQRLSAQLEGQSAQLEGQIAQLERQSAERERHTVDLRLENLAITNRVDAVAEAFTQDLESRTFRPTFSSIDFDERFRGSRPSVLLRYSDIADLLVATGGPVLDLGCGRGELIELVMAKGTSVRGVELNDELIDFCRSIFLEVTKSDLFEALLAEPDDSLGGIALIQVVEHITAQQLAKLVSLAKQKLREGGILCIETPNGTSPFIYTRSFYCDPTHTTPVHHEYLSFLLETAGFSTVDISWRSIVAEADRIPYIPVESEDKQTQSINESIHRLNMHLYGPQDYLAVAKK